MNSLFPHMTTPSRSEFSHRTRSYNLGRLRAEIFDILVIGGGIMGAGIAREAALLGYKVALVDKDDFASGTTSQSVQLVNFDIADLEKSRFDRLYEIGREQRRLAPFSQNTLYPMPLVLPTYRSRAHDSSLVGLGMWMYDGFPMLRGQTRHRSLTTEQITALAPGLDVSDIIGGVRYYVSWANGARFAMEAIRSAHHHKAVAVNHFQVEQLSRSGGRRVDGIVGRDAFTGETIESRARVVVNATGPWTDEIMALDAGKHSPRHPLVRRVHLLARKADFPLEQGIAFMGGPDSQWMFALPIGEFALIGPFQSEYKGSPDRIKADRAEVDEILASVATCFPGLPLERKDIVSIYAGLKPIRLEQSSRGEAHAGQWHDVVTPGGLVTAPIGDLITFRLSAQHIISKAEKFLAGNFGVHPPYPNRASRSPLARSDGYDNPLALEQQEVLDSLGPPTREHLRSAYGPRQREVLNYVVADKRLSSPILDGLPYIRAEILHAVEHEMAASVGDVMMRRLDLFHEVPDGACTAAREIATYMGRLLNWLGSDIEQEVRNYSEQVHLNREALGR